MKRTQKQLWESGRGGARKGAGRKPSGPRKRTSHAAREELTGRDPIHVTVRLVEGLPNLRCAEVHQVLRLCFAAGSDRFGFRLVEYSVQGNHLHFITEAEDTEGLSRGMQGLLIRIAKALNRLWVRKGSIFADRYHARVLDNPRMVRNGLVYVLQNARKHGVVLRYCVDGFSSAAWFEGWKDLVPNTQMLAWRVTAQARTWLLRIGWKLYGLIATHEVPARALA